MLTYRSANCSFTRPFLFSLAVRTIGTVQNVHRNLFSVDQILLLHVNFKNCKKVISKTFASSGLQKYSSTLDSHLNQLLLYKGSFCYSNASVKVNIISIIS